MANYTGIDCPICKKKFTTDDDIVVCPNCGAPHHRECYKELGHCSNIKSHTKELLNSQYNSDKIKVCPRCGTVNLAENKICNICSSGFKVVPNLTASKNTIHEHKTNGNEQGFGHSNIKFSDIPQIKYPEPHMEINGESLSDINKFIGVNSIYYISKMKLNPNPSNFLSWNWSAFFLTYIYFFYRKMYKAGIAFFLLFVISFAPTMILAQDFLKQVIANPSLLQTFNFDITGLETVFMLSRFTSNIPFVISLISGLKANSLYCTHVFIKLNKLHTSTQTPEEFHSEALRQGGVSVAMALGITVLTVILYFSTISFIAMGVFGK